MKSQFAISSVLSFIINGAFAFLGIALFVAGCYPYFPTTNGFILLFAGLVVLASAIVNIVLTLTQKDFLANGSIVFIRATFIVVAIFLMLHAFGKGGDFALNDFYGGPAPLAAFIVSGVIFLAAAVLLGVALIPSDNNACLLKTIFSIVGIGLMLIALSVHIIPIATLTPINEIATTIPFAIVLLIVVGLGIPYFLFLYFEEQKNKDNDGTSNKTATRKKEAKQGTKSSTDEETPEE